MLIQQGQLNHTVLDEIIRLKNDLLNRNIRKAFEKTAYVVYIILYFLQVDMSTCQTEV